MAANTNPIYTKNGRIDWGSAVIATANTAKDGSGTVVTAFTADATNGSYVQRIRFRAAGSNVVTVARIFVNNGSANSTPANNILYDEITLPATTLSETAALALYELPLNLVLPAGYKILVTIGTTVAAGYYVSCVGGDY